MINTSVLSQVFNYHTIKEAVMIEKSKEILFLIKEMDESIDLNRWEHLENILTDLTGKQIILLPYDYTSNYIKTKEGVTIKSWIQDTHY